VITCHGMGQQVPFETLNAVADGLVLSENRARGRDPEREVGVVKLEPSGLRLPRVALMLRTARDEPCEAHLYEAYWAPFTEGKIRDRDVVGFLVAAGRNGLLRGWGSFQRVAFGAVQTYPHADWTWLSFLAAFVLFGALIVVQAVVTAVVGARLLLGTAVVPPTVSAPNVSGPMATGWLDDPLLGDLTVDLLLLAFPIALILLGTQLPSALRRAAKARDFWTTWKLNPLLLGFCWAMVVLALFGTVVVAGLLLLHVAYHQTFGALSRTGSGMLWQSWLGWNWFWFRDRNAALWPPLGRALGLGAPALLWLAAYWASLKARWFFRQYMGDVAIYVTPHTLDRFWETRQTIKEWTARVGDAIYGAVDEQGWPLYDQIVVVGHSLGSVVAYDMLNQLLERDAIAGNVARVTERTPLFLTFGSPLDKIAYVFGTQRANARNVDQALAAAVQPLVMEYARRPAQWLNLYSPNDWISGSLDYFDTTNPADTPAPFQGKRVVNLVDPEATTPLEAHNEYWRNMLFTERLYGAVTA
jgi:hypothetical protein